MNDKLKKLLDQRARLWSEVNDIRSRLNGGATLTAEERTTYERGLSEVETMSAEIESLGGAASVAYSATPAPGGGFGDGTRGQFRDGVPLNTETRFVDWIRGRDDVDTRSNLDEPAQPLSLRKYLRGMVLGDWTDADAERRALSEGTATAGGYMVPVVLAGEIIDLARAQTRVMQAGARLVPMANKTLDVPKWTGDPSNAWHTEAATITPSDATLGSVRLEAQTLASLTKASRELLEDAPGVEDELRQAFAAQFALTVDYASLYGSGTDPEPRGVKSTSGITIQSMGTNGAAPTSFDYLVDAVGALQDNNEEPTAAIGAPRTERTLAKLKDANDQPLQPPQMLADLSRLSTTRVPVDLTQGTSNAASDQFVGDWRQLYIGLRTSLMVQVLKERYADTGEIGFLAWWRGDIAVARAKAFTVVEGILA